MALTKRQMALKIKAMWKSDGNCPIGRGYLWSRSPRGYHHDVCDYSPHNCKVCESVMGVKRGQVPQGEIEQYGEKCYCPCNFHNCLGVDDGYKKKKQLIKERLALLGIQLED